MPVIVESWEDSGVEPATVAWFSQYEPILMEFAERNNLAIAKYLKDSPCWHFVFTHPRGGQGRIDVTKVGSNEISLSAVWHMDNYDEGARRIKMWRAGDLTPNDQLPEELAAILERIMSWAGDDYEISSGFKDMWQKYMTREQVESSKYPLPRISPKRNSRNEDAT